MGEGAFLSIGLIIIALLAIFARVGPMAQRMGSEQPVLPSDSAREIGRKEMGKGFLWAAGGAILSGLTYWFARGGGVYVATWGAVAYGALLMLRGLWRFVVHR